MIDSQRSTIAEIIAAAPAYAARLRKMKLDRTDETIRMARQNLYAVLAYLLAVGADALLKRKT